MEDNIETYPGTFYNNKYTVYGVAAYVDSLHSAHAPFWVLQYFFYLAGNYHLELRWAVEYLSGMPYRGMTHEHDWEWVTVLVGQSEDVEMDYAPYVAALSSHSADGLEAFANGAYLFPCASVGTEFLGGNDPYVDLERRLASDGDEDCDDRAIVYMAATGNEFMKGPGTGIVLETPTILTEYPSSWLSTQYNTSGSDCEMVSTDRFLCYGGFEACDDGWFLEWLGETWICPQCDDACSGNMECDDCRDAPWRRDATWGTAGVPADFRFPSPAECRIDPEGQPEELALAAVTGIPGGWAITWQLKAEQACTFFEVTVQEDGGHCGELIGQVPAEGEGTYKCEMSTALQSEDPIRVGSRHWRLPLTKVTRAELVGRHVMVLACKDEEGCSNLAVTKGLEVPQSQAADANTVEIWPSVVTERATIMHCASDSTRAEVTIISVEGRVVRNLTYGEGGPGWRIVGWDGRDDHGQGLPSGTYFVRVLQGGRAAQRQILLIR